VKANLTGLIHVQTLDKQLQALEALLGDLPQQVEEIKEHLQESRHALEEHEKTLVELRTTKALQEGELKDMQEKAQKYREQLYAVTSNREYDAITASIDNITEKTNEVETSILELLETEEHLSKEIAILEPEISELETKLSQTETELQKKVKATEVEYQALKKEREQLEKTLDQRALYQYERIRKGIGNNAVAELHGGACSGCFSYIPPQRQVEIKAMRQLLLCESCGRILVFHLESSTVPS